ncbi:10 TM acyl transferase domain found in Cas1p-domain-containing protein [Spinellus fusiger]|nr:10 TM acyl transferase domain found in Cas1p-domain-containing protein [Spinellus fusiger]
MGVNSATTIQSKAIVYGTCAIFTGVLLSAVFRFVFGFKDYGRCHDMLQDGWWLDDTMSSWQPAGCMLHNYKVSEMSTCLGHSRVLYIGDSTMREQFLSMVQLVKKDINIQGVKHEDRLFEFKKERLTFEFWWDPYLNSTRTLDLLQARLLKRPSILIMGAGSWHMKNLEEDYFEEWRKSVDQVFNSVQGARSIAESVIMSPVEIPQYEKLSPERHNTITVAKIESMNRYLKEKNSALEPKTPFALPFVWNKITAGINNGTQDGLHYISALTKVQAQLGLNFRCNDQLPKTYPMASTCCYHYPKPKWYQSVFFLFFLIWVPLGIYLISSGVMKGLTQRIFPNEPVLNACFLFGLCILYMFFSDRTQMFGKIHKHFDPITFGGLSIAVLMTGLWTLKTTHEGDLGFLNRDQTNEWKGWMQLAILVYHYTGASGTSGIYNAVRVLVAAYLFQTGYGHFFFFYKKGDFGLGRALNVLVRLNMLTFVLQYVMNTDYLSYYFTPLVTFWFGIIWVTMYINHKANKVMWFMLTKIVIASLLTTTLIHYPGLMESVFDILEYVFNIHWNAVEWRFRLGLDAWIVYIGMLSAYAYIKCIEYKMHELKSWSTIKKTSIVLSWCVMAWYFWFELTRANKSIYNTTHPYIAWLPILAFVILRNATVQLRNTSSRFFAFIGNISLETFIGQFHMWLAADTKGLVVVLAHPEWTRGLGWWVNLFLSTILFLCVSYCLSQTTTELTKWICSGVNQTKPEIQPAAHHENQDYRAIPLLPTAERGTQQDASNAEATTVNIPMDDLHQQNIDGEWSQTPLKPTSWVHRFTCLCSDMRVKCALFIAAVSIANHMC